MAISSFLFSLPLAATGVVIDTDFGANFQTNYPAVWSSMQANAFNSAIAHLPSEDLSATYGVSVGVVKNTKTGNFPQNRFSVPVEVGKTYRVQADLPLGEAQDASWAGFQRLKLGTARDANDYLELDTSQSGQPKNVAVDQEITATGTELWFAIINETSIAGANGGDPVIASLTVTEVTPSGATLSVTNQTSVSAFGASLTFSAAAPAGMSVDGYPIIDTSGGPITITADTPAASIEDGVDANGLTKNAWFDGGSDDGTGLKRRQGFDGRMTGRGDGYDASENVSPTKSGNGSITIAQGERAVLTKCIPRAGKTVGDDKVAEVYVDFYFMPLSETEDGMFAPPPQIFAADALTAAPVFTESDINYSVLQNYTPPSGAPTLSTALAPLTPRLGFYGRMGDTFRTRSTDTFTGSGYLGDIGVQESTLLYALHYNNTNAAKRDAVIHTIRRGLEVDGMYRNGQLGSTGAGQWHGYHNYLFFAAFLLGDSDMLTRAQTMQSNMRDHPAWTPAWIEGNAVAHPTGAGQLLKFRNTFMPEDAGKPHWIEGFNEESNRGSEVVSRYITLSLPIGQVEMPPILYLQNGPGGVSGVDAFLDGPADTTNDRYAALKLMDRIKTWKDRERFGGANFEIFAPFAFNFDDHLETWPQPTGYRGWTGLPDRIEAFQTANQNVVTAADGGFSWDITGFDFSGNQTITDRHVRWSVDERTYVETSGHGETGSITGLPRGVDLYVQIALENATGKGPWSPNFPYSDTGGNFANGPRNVVQATGSEANSAPVNVVAPAIAYRKYPDFDGTSWEPAPATLTLSTMRELSAGVGHWSGFPAPTYTFQWRRDGVDISGATSQDYTLTAADLDTDLTCFVTATNSTSSASLETAAVTVPALASLPAGTIVDTQFDGDFLLRYETEYAAALSNQPSYELRYGFRVVEAAVRGMLDVQRTDAADPVRPEFTMDLPGTLQSGTTYRFQADLKNGANQGSSTGITIQIRRQSDATVLSTVFNNTDDVFWQVDQTFTPSQNENIEFHVIQGSGNGSATGPKVSALRITEAA